MVRQELIPSRNFIIQNKSLSNVCFMKERNEIKEKQIYFQFDHEQNTHEVCFIAK